MRLKDLIKVLRKKCLSISLLIIQENVDQYNNTIHSAIKMTPNEASRKENENKVWRNLYSEFGGKTLTQKFSIGDNVRITKKKNVFDKGYTQR